MACIQARLHQQQPWSNQAKSALSKANPQGTAVKMELKARDVYWHVVARLLKENTDIASPLINSGRVFAYEGYWGVRRPELSKTGEYCSKPKIRPMGRSRGNYATVGHDRGRWQASRTLDICHLVKNATTLLETIMLNGTPR